MCLIALGVGLRSDVPLMLAANRDEFFARHTQPAEFWPDSPHVLAGRDLEQGGTWLGLTRSGRVAAVTNFREGGKPRSGQRSRGWLVRDYLLYDQPPERYLSDVHEAAAQYDGFNLLVGAGERLYHYSNKSGTATPLTRGVHGLSNHLLDTPWPKVERARSRVAALADAPRRVLIDRLFELLADDSPAPDEELPRTGVPVGWERALSSAFIRTQDYGTRSSTVILVHANNETVFEERSFAPDGSQTSLRQYRLRGVTARDAGASPGARCQLP